MPSTPRQEATPTYYEAHLLVLNQPPMTPAAAEAIAALWKTEAEHRGQRAIDSTEPIAVLYYDLEGERSLAWIGQQP